MRHVWTILLSIGAVITRSGYFIVTPLWLDYFHKQSNSTNTSYCGKHSSSTNKSGLTNWILFNTEHLYDSEPVIYRYSVSAIDSPRLGTPERNLNMNVNGTQWYYRYHDNNETDPSDDEIRGISVCFLMLFQWGFCALAMGIVVLFLRCVTPGAIGPVETSYPKRQFVLLGFAMGLSSILFNYSVSGSRTPPYIIGILGNFNIPIQFVTRFVILRKHPTCLKFTCALVIIAAEFVCLLPTIFPGLQSAKDRQEDGGATGVSAILWPLVMVASMIPFAVSNTLTEKTVQTDVNKDVYGGVASNGTFSNQQQQIQYTHQNSSHDASTVTSHNISDATKKINIFYFQFWFFFCVFVTAALMFWVDLLPWFGTSQSWQLFLERLHFDVRCQLGLHTEEGGARCPAAVVALGWANVAKALLAATLLSALMRHSEGANYVVILLTLRTPIVLLWWSLFCEQPFAWHPHAHLSTWLSVGAVAFMLPAVVLYEIGDELLEKWRSRRAASPDRARLVNDSEEAEVYDDYPIY